MDGHEHPTRLSERADAALYAAKAEGPVFVADPLYPHHCTPPDVSFYRFMEGCFLEPGAIPLDEVVAQIMFDLDEEYSYWTHASSWLRQRDNPDVLLVTFEDMKHNHRQVP